METIIKKAEGGIASEISRQEKLIAIYGIIIKGITDWGDKKKGKRFNDFMVSRVEVLGYQHIYYRVNYSLETIEVYNDYSSREIFYIQQTLEKTLESWNAQLMYSTLHKKNLEEELLKVETIVIELVLVQNQIESILKKYGHKDGEEEWRKPELSYSLRNALGDFENIKL